MKLAEDLKKAVLQAAMQGKLTKQLETDSSVDELLKNIAEEKAKLIAEGKIKKDTTKAGSSGRALAEITEEEIPFDIPENWRWTRLRNIVYSRGQKTPDKKFSYIDIGSINNQKQILSKNENIIEAKDAPSRARKIVAKNDVIYSTVRPYLHNMCIIDKDFSEEPIASTGFAVMTCIKILPEFLLKYLLSPDFDAYANDHENSKGVTYPAINDDRLYKALFPLPPIEEQQRIVEKLNQILPLIDEYGKEEDELIELCQKFPEEMKKSVLQAAMQGKLTKQLESDSSVDELLKKIAKEKAKLIAEGKIRKGTTKAGSSGRALAEITEEEIPFDIPENWRWTRLRNIVYSRGQKTPDKKFSYIDIGSINNQKQILSKNENIIEAKDAPSRARKIVAKNDVIYSTVRPYLHNMCIIDKDFSEEPIASTGFAVMTCIKILPEFLLKYLLSPDFDAYANDHENSKGVAYPAINDDRLYKALIPIPPIEEQQRIVEKLNTILPIIDSMAVYGTKKKAGRPKQEEALAFISSLLGTKKQAESKPVSPEITELKAKAKEELPAIVKKYAERMDVTYNRITIRHQKTRWGSCTKTGNLNFNCLIMKMPETVRDYVIIHELSHRKELNHSTKFWAVVAEYCPWYKEAKQWLKENGQKLMEIK